MLIYTMIINLVEFIFVDAVVLFLSPVAMVFLISSMSLITTSVMPGMLILLPPVLNSSALASLLRRSWTVSL